MGKSVSSFVSGKFEHFIIFVFYFGGMSRNSVAKNLREWCIQTKPSRKKRIKKRKVARRIWKATFGKLNENITLGSSTGEQLRTHFILDPFRKTIDELPTEQNLQKYIQLLTTVLSIDRVKYDLQKLVFDAYFVRAISVDIFNNTSVTELELIDTKLNLLVNDEDKYFYANPVIGKEVERQ